MSLVMNFMGFEHFSEKTSEVFNASTVTDRPNELKLKCIFQFS